MTLQRQLLETKNGSILRLHKVKWWLSTGSKVTLLTGMYVASVWCTALQSVKAKAPP